MVCRAQNFKLSKVGIPKEPEKKSSLALLHLEKRAVRGSREGDFITIFELLNTVTILSNSATPWTAACQDSLSFTICWSLLKSITTELVMPSNHFLLYRPLLLLSSIFPSIRVFSKEWALCIDGQCIGASASASVFPMNIQCRFPLGLTGFISLQSKGFSTVFSNTTVQKHHSLVFSLLYGPTLTWT